MFELLKLTTFTGPFHLFFSTLTPIKPRSSLLLMASLVSDLFSTLMRILISWNFRYTLSRTLSEKNAKYKLTSTMVCFLNHPASLTTPQGYSCLFHSLCCHLFLQKLHKQSRVCRLCSSAIWGRSGSCPMPSSCS